MKPLIHMTGPHPSRLRRNGKPVAVWHVAIVDSETKQRGTIYRCLTYRRALSLSCNMAQDRNLFLHMDALPS